MERLSKIFLITGIFFLFLGIILSIITFIEQGEEYKETKCYDKYGNEIIGQTCLQEVFSFKLFETLSFLSLFISIICFFFSLFQMALLNVERI